MNPLMLITISFIIPYFLKFYIYLYSQNVLTFISTKIPETFYFHVLSLFPYFLNFHIMTLRNSLKKNFESQIKTLVPIPYKSTLKNSASLHPQRKTPPLLQVIQKLETNSKDSFVISKSWTLNLFCDLYKQNKLLVQLLKQIFIMLQHNDFLYNGIIRANYKSL